MTRHYQLGPNPVVIPLGPHGRAAVHSSVPFTVDSGAYCADFGHTIDLRRRPGIFRALGSNAAGVMRVQPLGSN